jgi:chromosome segregation ATPase
VEQRLLDGINEFVKSFQSKETKKSNDKYTKQIAVLEKLLTKANEELIDLNTQKDNTYTYLEKGIYTIEVFQERQKKISSEISEVENKIQQLSSDLHKAKHNQNNMESYIPQLIEVLKAYRKTESIEKKNRLLKSILEKATFLRTQEMKHKSEFIIQIYPKIKA